MTDEFERMLQKYADVLVRVGVNLQPGKRLLIMGPVSDDPAINHLIRLIAQQAYVAGASFVDVMWNDAFLNKIRLENAAEDTLDEFSAWRYAGLREFTESERVAALWKIIFACCHLDPEDPVADWRRHVDNLMAYCAVLNQKHYAALYC